MQMLKDAILERGKALNQDILLVDSFLNHQVDVALMKAVGETFAEHFANRGITSGDDRKFRHCARIFYCAGVGASACNHEEADLPHFERRSASDNGAFLYKGDGVSTVRKARVLNADDNILLIDDFLASGEAAFGVITLAEQVGAKIGGVGIVIEKAFQSGHKRLEDAGIDVYSLARIASMSADRIEFVD